MGIVAVSHLLFLPPHWEVLALKRYWSGPAWRRRPPEPVLPATADSWTGPFFASYAPSQLHA